MRVLLTAHNTMINVDEMVRYLSVVKGLSKKTVYSITNRLNYINKRLVTEVTQEAFLDLIAEKKENCAASTTNSLVVAWNHYINYLKYFDFPCPYKSIDTQRSKPSPTKTFLSPEQMRSIAELQYPYNQNRDYLNQLYRALFMFYALTGARVSEAINLKVKDVSLANRSCWFTHTKNGDQRKVLLPDELIELMIPLCKTDGEKYVFRSSRGGKYDQQDVNDELHRRCEVLGYDPKTHVHLFRHSFVSHLLQAGVDITTVARMIGHRNINTTFAIYGHLVDAMFRSALDKHPLVLDKLDPQTILKQDLEQMKKLRIFQDKRFKAKIIETDDAIEVSISVKE